MKAGETRRRRRCARRSSRTRRAAQSRVDPRTVEADARRAARRSVHARRLALRAQARRLSPAREQVEAARRCSSRATATTTRTSFPRSRARCKALPFDECIIDGEVVVLRRARASRASRCCSGAAASRRRSTSAARRSSCRRRSSRSTSSPSRTSTCGRCRSSSARSCSRRSFPKLGAVRVPRPHRARGRSVSRAGDEAGPRGHHREEGRRAVPRAGASTNWLKIKAEQTGDFVIVGFTEPKGTARDLGALQLADYVNGTLVYAGRVGTGFNDALLQELHGDARPDRARAIRRARARCTRPARSRCRASRFPETRTTTWVGAALRLRSALSASGRPTGCCGTRRSCACATTSVRTNASGRAGDVEAADDAQPATADDAVTSSPRIAARAATAARRSAPFRRRITFSNPKKIFWPAEKYTKGDLIDYYRAIVAVAAAVPARIGRWC